MPPQSRTIAWDRVSFRVPANWDLAVYKFLRRRVTHIEIEDEYAVRLEAEWTRSKGPLDIQKIQERYRRKTRKLTKAAQETGELKDLPAGWAGFEYRLSDGAKLVSAFVLGGKSKMFCFFRIHFSPQDREKPGDMLETISSSFEEYEGELVRWAAYDRLAAPPRR